MCRLSEWVLTQITQLRQELKDEKTGRADELRDIRATAVRSFRPMQLILYNIIATACWALLAAMQRHPLWLSGGCAAAVRDRDGRAKAAVVRTHCSQAHKGTHGASNFRTLT